MEHGFTSRALPLAPGGGVPLPALVMRVVLLTPTVEGQIFAKTDEKQLFQSVLSSTCVAHGGSSPNPIFQCCLSLLFDLSFSRSLAVVTSTLKSGVRGSIEVDIARDVFSQRFVHLPLDTLVYPTSVVIRTWS